MSAADFHSLSRVCVDGVCHCDWRLTIQDCVESEAMTIIHGINIGICGVAVITGKKIHIFFKIYVHITNMYVIIGIGLLGHRVIIKGHTLFDNNLAKGCFRPKPIDCMLLFIIFFNLCK